MIVAVTGTGTGIGKTHLACALVGALRDRGTNAVGWKPVESGVAGESPDSDEALLRAASGVDLPPTLRLHAPISPHLAARREGKTIDAAAIRATLDALAARHDTVVLELAGGLCSPFDDRVDNLDFLADLARTPPERQPPIDRLADLARTTPPERQPPIDRTDDLARTTKPDRAPSPLGDRIDSSTPSSSSARRVRTILVAPDRLGVLHDVSATLRAAAAVDLEIHAIALVAPAVADESTAANASELRTRLGVEVVEVPRRPIVELRRLVSLIALVESSG